MLDCFTDLHHSLAFVCIFLSVAAGDDFELLLRSKSAIKRLNFINTSSSDKKAS